MDPQATQPAGARARLGRPRDASRDADILEATIEVLAEQGFDGMTIDMVAARAGAGKATVYRRWPSKADLVIDAVACMKKRDLDPAQLPDTGTLRGDLIALVRAPSAADSDRKMHVMGGILSLMSREPELARTAYAAILQPRIAANRILLERARGRGETRPDIDVDRLAALMPAMSSFRTLAQREPITREFLISLIDDVLLPAAGVVRAVV
ncbi:MULTISPECIES: TetR/AcrR family transcriptional regulator [Microbacterium]|uniref:TetR/AcrR family transcriptional regulator n=1 Tax=Microbacterium schleiferi TaxID=69362 RepID=A0ABU7V856_9MICO|nr:TetR/AcrR family transcriptional regulator [Micrococcales bacterium]